VVLLLEAMTVEALRDAVQVLLADEGYRSRARRLAEEMARMPDPDAVAAVLIDEVELLRTVG